MKLDRINNLKISGAVPATLSAVLWIALLAGCDAGVDPELARFRSELLLQQEPTQVSSIEDAKKKLAVDRGAVTVRGMADVEALSADGRPRALMLVREILPDDHGHQPGHDPSSCPFCKRRMEAAPKAAVEFVGEDGNVLPFEVQELFGIEQGDLVVVQGTADLDKGLDIMKITATGIHIGADN